MNPRFHDVLFGRRSVRKYSDADVTDDVILRLVQAALAAPSAHNSQPARFVVLRRGETRSRLIRRMADRYLADMTADGLDPETIRERLQESDRLLGGAPIIILVCLTMRNMHTYPDDVRSSHEYTMAVQSTSAAIQNILLAAHAEGLGACWVCAPLFCKDVVKSELGLPDDYDPQAFVLLGHPAENPPLPPRRTTEEVMRIM
ncbi:MAG: nitroreductase family protein [Candidatus Thorarchaeota archaeon]